MSGPGSIGPSTSSATRFETEPPQQAHPVEDQVGSGVASTDKPVLVAWNAPGFSGFAPNSVVSPVGTTESPSFTESTPETVQSESSETTEAPLTPVAAGTGGPAQGASPVGGTNVINNLAGRDPDLIYAGETIKLANGKTHIVKAGETLGGIAAANGMKLEDLIKANGMNDKLLGKNSSGAYFSVGSAQPAPGSTLVSAPKVVAPTVSSGSNQQTQQDPLPKGDQLAVLRDFLKTEASGDTAGRTKAIEDRIASPDAELSDADRAVLLGIQNDYRSKHPEAVAPQQAATPTVETPVSTPASTTSASDIRLA